MPKTGPDAQVKALPPYSKSLVLRLLPVIQYEDRTSLPMDIGHLNRPDRNLAMAFTVMPGMFIVTGVWPPGSARGTSGATSGRRSPVTERDWLPIA